MTELISICYVSLIIHNAGIIIHSWNIAAVKSFMLMVTILYSNNSIFNTMRHRKFQMFSLRLMTWAIIFHAFFSRQCSPKIMSTITREQHPIRQRTVPTQMTAVKTVESNDVENELHGQRTVLIILIRLGINHTLLTTFFSV